MSTKTTIKRIALVAAVAAAFGGLSTVAANAAGATALATTVTTVTTGAQTATTPTAQGTAVTANLFVTPDVTPTGAVTIPVTWQLFDPAGNDVSSSVTFTAPTLGTGVTSSVFASNVDSVTLATTATGTTSTQVGTASWTPTEGGIYTWKYSYAAVAAGVNGAIAAKTIVAVDTTPSFYVSGTFVSQGTTVGGPAGKAQTGNQAQITVTLPIAAAVTYKVATSGVGAINGVKVAAGVANSVVADGTGGGVTSFTNVSGVTTDFSQGVFVLSGTGAAHGFVLTLTSASNGVQTVAVSTVNAATGVATALYTTTVTWSGASVISPAASLVRQAPTTTTGDGTGNTTAATNYTTTLNAAPISAAKAAGTNASTIEVILLNADGTAATQGNKITASVTGSGLITVDGTSTVETGSNRAQSFTPTVGINNTAWVHVSADGTAGTGTVTVTVTDINGVTTTLGTETQTYYGSVASLKIVATNYNIGKAGYTTGSSAANRYKDSEALNPLDHTTALAAGETGAGTSVPAFVVEALDSNGNPVSISAPSVATADSTVVTGGTCTADAGNSTTYSSGAGVGFYNCSFSTAANAVSGAKTTLTIKTLNPSDATGTTYLTASYPVSVGGKVAKETLTTDATSYAPGAQMLVTFTAKDSAGNPVYDGATSPGAVSANLALGGAAGFTGWYVGGVDASAASVAKSTLYAPSIAGNLTLTATGDDAASTVLTANATVSGGVTDTAASAATDAANEATDAANAATDAANAAADAADAATSAAQDAGAKADAALAAVTALSAKITVLAAQIAKIVKKLGA